MRSASVTSSGGSENGARARGARFVNRHSSSYVEGNPSFSNAASPFRRSFCSQGGPGRVAAKSAAALRERRDSLVKGRRPRGARHRAAAPATADAVAGGSFSIQE